MLALAVGLVTFFSAIAGSDAVVGAFGIPTYISYDEPRLVAIASGPTSYEDEMWGDSTTAGAGTLMLSLLVGIWAGTTVYERRWDGAAELENKVASQFVLPINRAGSPTPRGAGVQIGMRWQAQQLEGIDNSRREQPDLPSRPEAIRPLVELALGRKLRG
jgi:hypothetical protein